MTINKALKNTQFTTPRPIACKYCHSKDISKYGQRSGIQYYICKACKRKFTGNNTPFHMHTSIEQIGTALSLFYDGLSLADISQNLNHTWNNPVNPSTVYRWLIRYTTKALRQLEPLKPHVSNTWVVDETVINVSGRNLWFWDVIDEDTRFLIASYLSEARGIKQVMTVMARAQKRTGKSPNFIISDGLPAYPDGIERIFGSEAKHIRYKGFTSEINGNLIERFHSTIKERTKVLRAFKSMDTAELILDGFLIDYNFFRPHMALKDKTPAEVAKITSDIKTWIDVVRGS